MFKIHGYHLYLESMDAANPFHKGSTFAIQIKNMWPTSVSENIVCTGVYVHITTDINYTHRYYKFTYLHAKHTNFSLNLSITNA